MKTAVLMYAKVVARNLGKDADGDLFTFFGKTYWVDIMHSVVSKTSMPTIPSNVNNVVRDIICLIGALRKDSGRTMIITVFEKKYFINLMRWSVVRLK